MILLSLLKISITHNNSAKYALIKLQEIVLATVWFATVDSPIQKA